jgi:uncharacterized pyridoxal phosphate-containing UPF0001 family protein
MKQKDISGANPPSGSLATRLASVQQAIREPSALQGAVRSPEGEPEREARTRGSEAGAGRPHAATLPPKIVAASKTQPISVLEEAIALGITEFGENKVQEAQSKWPALKTAHPQLRLHLIGPLQSNKAAEALALFDVIHTVDRPKLVDALVKGLVVGGAQREAREENSSLPRFTQAGGVRGGDIYPPPTTGHRFLVQVNTGEEPQKAGVIPAELPALLAYCAEKGLPICGLMCIPPAHEPAAPHFALLQKLAKRHGLSELSMGMSDDYALAARFGATMVRIGTALFGARS